MRILALVLFVGWLVRLSLIDLRERRLPNRLTVPGAAGVLGYAATVGGLPRAAAGGAVLAGLYLAVHLAAPAAFGAGDVKLAYALGAAAALGGARVWALAALAAPAATAAAGIAVWVARGHRAGCWGRCRAGCRGNGSVLVPHGPSMCAATLLALAFGG